MRTFIRNYFKNGYVQTVDRLLGLFFPKLVYQVNAKTIVKTWHRFKNPPEYSTRTFSVNIDDYQYSNKEVIALSNFLVQHLSGDIAGAFVHGSVATDELIPYSDLDALVIIKDKVFADELRLLRVALKLKEAEKFMYALDPLQHHGWFVLTEDDLLHFDNNYFPAELFPYCKSIFPKGLKKFKINIEKDNSTFPLINLCKSVERKTAPEKCPATMYELKILLSEFMLLPALYVQARDGIAVFKKFSFDKAKIDFSEDEWRIMNDVSLIREQWSQKNVLMEREHIASRLALIPFLSQMNRVKVPRHLKQKINPDFLKQMNQLAASTRIKMSE